MSLTAIEEIIAREVGQLCWYLLPDMHPGLKRDEKDEAFRSLWDFDQPDELRAVRAENPPVQYPVIYLELEMASGIVPAPFVYPPSHGQALRLSEYLNILKRFLILEFTTRSNAHVPLIQRAIRTLAADLSKDELLGFVDNLWRGRWIVGAMDWAYLRRSVMTGGTEEALREVESNAQRLEKEALRLIETERQLKDTARSMEEWLHEAYCLLPDIFSWLICIHHANKHLKSDELEKYSRVLDEFMADIMTTLQIPCNSARGGRSLAEEYAIKPLVEKRSIDEAIAKIRGIYRGRSIIPRVWYKLAENALNRLRSADLDALRFAYRRGKMEKATSPLPADDYEALNRLDLAQAFGRAMTMDSKKGHWRLLHSLFGYLGTNHGRGPGE